MYIPLQFIIRENLCHTTCLRRKGKVKDRARDTEKASKSKTVFELKDDVKEREHCNTYRCQYAAILPTLMGQGISSRSPFEILLLNHLSWRKWWIKDTEEEAKVNKQKHKNYGNSPGCVEIYFALHKTLQSRSTSNLRHHNQSWWVRCSETNPEFRVR